MAVSNYYPQQFKQCALSQVPPRVQYDVKRVAMMDGVSFDNIYYKLIEDGHEIKEWYYAHYHTSNKEIVNNISFTLLNCIEYKFELAVIE